MEGEASLQTFAEVSIALAGFASLLVVLRRGPSHSLSEGEGADLFVVVGGGLLVLVFSLLPLPLHHLGLSNASVWGISSVSFAVGLVLGYTAILRRRSHLLRSGIQPLFPQLSRASVHSPLVVVALLLLSAADVLVPRGPGPYLLSLLLLLALSALPLLFVIIELARGSER